MIPGNKEIALIQHRMGPSSQLPDYLESSEIAFTTDTGEVFIGAPTIHAIDGRERNKSNIYPYHNIQLLTELTDNAKIIKTEYSVDGVKVYSPIICNAVAPISSVLSSDSIAINGVTVNIGVGVSGVDAIISQINSANIENVTAYNVDSKIQLVATDGTSLILQDITSGALSKIGLVEEGISFKTIVPSSSYSRSLSDSISDRITLNTFGVSSNSDSSVLINSAIKTIYINDKTEAHKVLHANAGVYKLNSSPLYIPSNTTIKGEGVDQTIFETDNEDLVYLFGGMDDKGRPCGDPSFGLNSEQPRNVYFEDCCFKSNVDIDLIRLYGFKDVIFKHCKFVGSGSVNNKLVDIQRINGYNDISNITFENCIFENNGYGIFCEDVVKGLKLRDCSFSKITSEMVHLTPSHENAISNVLFDNCEFNEEYEVYYFNINENVSNCKIFNPIINQTTTTHNISAKCNILSTSTDLDYYNVSTCETGTIETISNIIDGDTIVIDYTILHPTYSRKGSVVKSVNAVVSTDLIDIYPSYEDSKIKWVIDNNTIGINNISGSRCTVKWKLSLIK